MSEFDSSDILEKLDKLQMWKNEQKMHLIERQQTQRHKLNLQHQEMYDILNLSKNVDSQGDDKQQQNVQEIPKKPFLKRNQGLKKRFNIDPDALRLNNLPQYKFANVHKFHGQPINKNRVVVPPPTRKANVEKIEDTEVQKPNESSNSSPISEPISWAKVLDPSNLKPLSLNRLSESTIQMLDESENLSIFELLEQKSNSSCQITDSFVRKWIEGKTNKSEGDGTVAAINEFYMSDIPPLTPKEKEDLESDDSSSFENVPPIKSVHFSNEICVSEIIDSKDYNSTSTPNNPRNVGRSSVSSANISYDEDEDTLLETNTSGIVKERIIESSDFLMQRLKELEEQIDTFKKSNRELTKEKQDHDLEKAHFEEEKIQFYAELNDDRIKMKNYFDQEKQKIENEKIRLKKIIDDNHLIKKERDLNSKLKKEITDLNTELKNREVKHTSAQSRLRSQNKILEKTIKDLNNEIDSYKQKLKMIESENTRMIRGNNSKILQEINRNIAKLSTNVNTTHHIVSSNIDCSNSARPAVANVISHKNQVADISKPNLLKDKSCEDDNDDQLRLIPKKQQGNEHDNNVEGFQRELINADGSKDIWYLNGNLKKISANGMFIKMLYFNKDIKETDINEGTIKYYYSETNTWHTTYIDGLEIIEFPNGHTEHRHKNGTVEIHFPNGAIKSTPPSNQQDNKLEEWKYPDGTTVIQLKNGDKILKMLNGQKEIHTQLHKRREYPDGTVKLLYPDGSHETRYSNGRVRLKDKDGNLVMDSEMF